MKALFSHLRPALVSTGVLTMVLCGLYPLAVWGVGQAIFKDKANGSLILDREGVVRGSSLLAQKFTDAGYFHPRPSVAGANGYDAAGSGGSNLGPTSEKLAAQIKERIATYRQVNGLHETEPVPADAVTTSPSGLDPHISIANARLQVGRISKARNLKAEDVAALIRKHTVNPDLGFLGNAGVNVLRLNIELDELTAASKAIEN